MKIIEFNSDLANGEFLCRFTFEDDTDVFYTCDGWDCENYNNIYPNEYYIELAKLYYNNLNK